MRSKNHKVMCSDDPCEALKQLIRNQSKRKREKCVKEVKPEEPNSAMYLDGEPAIRAEALQPRGLITREARRIYDPVLPSRGPPLEPSMACYEMANECRNYSNDARCPPSASCSCRGCACNCQASGPHCHVNNSAVAECAKDYCNYPDFEPLPACPEGNAWSGDVYTDCKWPAPCPATCFDHRPPTDWHGQSRRQMD